ncbi:MAG TPA: STAS domain-containing protein [Kofleriaceae bacterium]|nr:STAS domain-containing protein [Kofleriaceae bacterium]
MAILVSRTDQGDRTLLAIAGSLDALTAAEVMPSVDNIIDDRRREVVVDIAGLDLIDSSGVAVLVSLYKRLRARGGKVSVTGARDQPLSIFKLLRIDRVFFL